MIRILLVEDNAEYAAKYVGSLAGLGYEVIYADRSSRALEFYKMALDYSEKNHYDLVLTDTLLDTDNLPDGADFRYIEGIKLLINLLKMDPDARVVVMSSMKKNEAPALHHGALGFIKKDEFLPDRFKDELANYL